MILEAHKWETVLALSIFVVIVLYWSELAIWIPCAVAINYILFPLENRSKKAKILASLYIIVPIFVVVRRALIYDDNPSFEMVGSFLLHNARLFGFIYFCSLLVLSLLILTDKSKKHKRLHP